MNAGDALRAIRRHAIAGRVRFTRHARERMAERRAHVEDVLHALYRASSVRAEGDRWRVDSSDLDSDALVVIVVLEADVLVVTLF